MRFNENQMRTAATMFADLLISKDIPISTMSEMHRGLALYSGDPEQAKQVDMAERLDAYFKKRGKAAQQSVDDEKYHAIVAEIYLQLLDASENGNITDERTVDGVKSYGRDARADHLELRMTSQGSGSWEVGLALENIQGGFGYGSPRINICLYTDGGLDIWDRESGAIIPIDYESKPALPYGRPDGSSTSALSTKILSALPNTAVTFCRYGGTFHYKQVGREDSIPVIANGVATGEKLAVAEQHRFSDEEPYYLFLQPHQVSADFNAEALDIASGDMKGVLSISRYGFEFKTASDIDFYYLSRGLKANFEDGARELNPSHGTIVHRSYRYFQMAAPVVLGYAEKRVVAQAGDWISINRGNDGTSEPKLYRYTNAEMQAALASGALVQTDDKGRAIDAKAATGPAVSKPSAP